MIGNKLSAARALLGAISGMTGDVLGANVRVSGVDSNPLELFRQHGGTNYKKGKRVRKPLERFAEQYQKRYGSPDVTPNARRDRQRAANDVAALSKRNTVSGQENARRRDAGRPQNFVKYMRKSKAQIIAATAV